MTPKSNAPRVGDELASEKRTTERGLGVAKALGASPVGSTADTEAAKPVVTARQATETVAAAGANHTSPDRAAESEAEQFSPPVELVSSVSNEPRVFLIAPSSITVHVGRVSEPPPPVQITYSEPTRAIPYRAAIPIAIIIFATGVVAYSLLTRGNGHQRATTNLQPTAAATRTSGLAATSVQAPTPMDPVVAPSAAEPVILLDLPADDPQAPLPSAESPGDPDPAAKNSPSTRRARSRPKMHFQQPE